GAAGPQGLGVEYQRHFWPDTSKPASGKIRGLALGSIQDACPDNCFTRVINFSGGQGFSRKLTFNPPYSSSASGNPVTTSTGMRSLFRAEAQGGLLTAPAPTLYILCALLVAGENFAFGAQPILMLVTWRPAPRFINLIGALADLVFQIDRNNVLLYLGCN